MSYDLMVFDPADVPRDGELFMAWYADQTQWSQSHSYDDHEVSTPRLRAWFLEIIKEFPPLNGPLASDDEDGPEVTDYSIGRAVIYASFAWSLAESAYERVKALAAKHAVGFFDVSSECGEVWFPAPGGGLSKEFDTTAPFPRFDSTSAVTRSRVETDERGEISVWNFLVGYVLMIAALVSLATLGNALLGIDGTRMVCISGGMLFALAAIGKPRIVYLLVRNAGWFHHIRDPAVMRTILALLALFLCAVGFVAPNGALK